MTRALVLGLSLCLAAGSPLLAQKQPPKPATQTKAVAKTLYAAVRRYEGVTNSAEVSRRVNDGFLPLVSKLPGFVAYYLVDAGGGVVVSTGVFESQAAAEEST